MHWQGARPAALFWALRWLVAGLAGLALASVFQWWGASLSQAVKGSGLSLVDRLGGLALGAGLGAFVAAFLLLTLVMLPWPHRDEQVMARSRLASPVLAGAERVCALGERFFPGSGWLKQRFERALRRASPAVQPY